MPHPPSHRVGDKRRYYYYSGAPRYGGFKKGYSMGSSVSHSGGLMPINRPSRYDPHSPRKPINGNFSSPIPSQTSGTATGALSGTKVSAGTTGSSIRAGSRYNPDVDVSASTMDGPLNGGVSRYSGSRYNSHSRSRLETVTSSSNINSPGGYYSRSNKWRMGNANPNKIDYDNPSNSNGGGGRPPFWKFQKRSVAPVPTRGSYHGLPSHVHTGRPSSPGPSSVSGPPSRVATAPANLSVSAYSHSHSYSHPHSHPHPHPYPYSHSHLHTSSRSQSPITEESMMNHQAKSRSETPAKKSTPIASNTPVTRTDGEQMNMPPQPSQSMTSAPSTTGASASPSSEITESRAGTPSITLSSAAVDVPSRMESPRTSRSVATISTPVSSKIENPKPEVNSTNLHTPTIENKKEQDTEEPSKVQDNPHSLGSSLINSVPQQTRKQKHKDSIGDNEEPDHNNNNNNNINNDTFRIGDNSGDINNDDDDDKNISDNNGGHNEVDSCKDEEDDYSDGNRGSNNLWSSRREIAMAKTDIFPDLRFSAERSTTSYHEKYEYIYDPEVLKQDWASLEHEEEKGYDKPLKVIEACIFPMTREQTRLWELKNQSWDRIIALQHHRLKDPIKDIKSYPFVRQNIIRHKQAIKPSLCNCISKLKRHEYLQKLKLQKEAQAIDQEWQDKCRRMDAMSHELHKEEIRRKKRQEMEAKEKESKEKESKGGKGRSLSSSRRCNRADFVDDAEMENVLLQIDPLYKHIQAAAEIPPMIVNPLQKYSFKYKDVSNLVTDKDGWARRVQTDGVDNFAQHEHELFVEAYLSFPKKFLKISNYLGNLRTPEECVLHYYRTKSVVDYKKLLIERNKKRQKASATKRRKRERANDTDNESSLSISEHGDNKRKEPSTDQLEQGEMKSLKHMEQVEIKVDENSPMQANGSSQQINGDQQQSPSDEGGSMSKFEEVQRHVDSSMDNGSLVSNNFDEGQQRYESTKKMTSGTAVTGDPTMTKSIISSTPLDHRDDSGEITDMLNEDVQQRKRHKHSGEHKSSYWSVKEATLFPDLLKEYGSQWSLISARLGTKSTTMVRNYYQRNAAQSGWKPLVEEADFKRNATSSESVQQSQMLLQSEQGQLAVSNGVPSQQWPTLGFFSNGSGGTTNTTSGDAIQDVPSVAVTGETSSGSVPAGAAQQSFGSTFNSKESFLPDISSPVNGLPPPRLPSILLPVSSEGGREKPATSGSQLNNLMDSEDPARPKASSMNEWNRPLPRIGVSSTLAVDPSQWSNVRRPQPPSRELQGADVTFSNSNCRSSSLSLLLNPDVDRPVTRNPLTPLTSETKRQPINQIPRLQVQPPQKSLLESSTTPATPKINFAMDPLRALAAVASESLLETDKNNQLSHK